MKNIIKLSVLGVLTAGVLTACASSETADSSSSANANASTNTVITVGASITPHAEILREAAPLLEEKGFELKIVEYTDYILPNTALDSGDIDANFFQHTPYLDEFNLNNGTDITSALSVHFEPFGLYTDKPGALSDLPEGAVIAVPNDTSNEARALLLLEANGLIKLREGAGLNATVLDIVENPKNFEIREIEAPQLPRILPDVRIAAINGNYALQGGLTSDDALAFEDAESVSAQTYANILAVNTDELDSEKTKALVEVLSSDEIREFITSTYGGAVIPVF